MTQSEKSNAGTQQDQTANTRKHVSEKVQHVSSAAEQNVAAPGVQAIARTKSFRDDKGNRMIFPNLVIHPEDPDGPTGANVVLRSMTLGLMLRLDVDDGWLEFDPERFPHVRSIACSPSFKHGGATVLLFEGPEFDAVAKAEA